MTAEKADKKLKTTSKVAQIIGEYLKASGKSQTQVSIETGYEKPNIISLLKTGNTRMPYSRIKPFCRSTGGDVETLFMACLEEYHPDILEVITEIKGTAVSQFDREALRVIRAAKRQAEDALREERQKNARNFQERSYVRDLRLKLDRSPEAVEGLAQYIAKHMLVEPDPVEH